MEKIVEKKMKVKYVPVQTDEFDEIITYKTADGIVFKNEWEAEAHENNLKFQTIDHVCSDEFSFYDIGERWYRAKNDVELKMLKERLIYKYADVYGDKNIKVGEWFSYRVHDGGDSTDTIVFTTFSEFEDIIYKIKDMLAKAEILNK